MQGFFVCVDPFHGGDYYDLVFTWVINVDKCQLDQNLSIYRIILSFSVTFLSLSTVTLPSCCFTMLH